MVRVLPPLNALRAFEAAARHLSFTKAAEELCVTQGAISRQIASLEMRLAHKLFLRRHRGIDLTTHGLAYFRAVQDSLDRLEEATNRMLPAGHGRTLRIKLPPTLAIRWVVPRLARLHALNRDIDVQITTSHAPVDFEREDIDVAVHSGDQPPRDVVSHRLFGETILPVCSPAILSDSGRPWQPADLQGRVLLCSLHRPDDWPTWIAAAGVTGIDGNSGLKFENSSLAYQAAIDRLGVVMAQRVLVAEDIAAGRLVAPIDLEVTTPGAYFLIYPRRTAHLEIVQQFVAWLIGEANADYNHPDARSVISDGRPRNSGPASGSG